MPFDEFLAKRLTELLRFAAVLVGDARLATEVVVDVMCRAFADWPMLAVGGRPFVAVRTGVVRHYLAGPHPDAPGMFGELTRPARAAVVLNVYSGQTTGEVADAMRTDVARTDALIAGARAALVASGGGVTLIDRLDEAADTAEVDAEAAAAQVLDRLERDDIEDIDPDLFGAAVASGGPADGDRTGENSTGPDEPESEPHGPHPLFAFFDVHDDHDVEGHLAGEDVSEHEDPDRRDGAPRRRLVALSGRAPLRVVSVLVIVAAAVLLGLVVGRDRQNSAADAAGSRPMPSTTTAKPVPRVDPANRIGYQLPGTRQLGRELFGSGSGTRRGGTHTVAAGRELAIFAVCSGSGGATIGPVVATRCDGTPVGAVVTPQQVRSLTIRADRSTTWRFAIVDEPAHGTNGALMYPASRLITAGSPAVTVARTSGTGRARIALPSGTANARLVDLRLLITCDGSGVTFSSADHAFDGQYTHTCFRGWSYEFDVDGANLPGTLVVQASAGTSWHLVVARR